MKRANVHSMPGRSPVTLGLDVGSTNLKAVALSGRRPAIRRTSQSIRRICSTP
jgi:activator of 2-hydroxyglutaryl-CoA dehydratase